jgi:hypothetical protein
MVNIRKVTHFGMVWFFALRWWNPNTKTVATTDIEHMHITVAKYITIVGNAVELAGIMPEMSKLNMTIDSRMVISGMKSRSLMKAPVYPYVMWAFHRYQVAEENRARS